MQAMIFAAGLGTRLYPLTRELPKALVEINGVTLLERVINKMIKAGISDIVINVHHFADKIIKFLSDKNFPCNIKISDERDLLLDTGGGVMKAFNDALFNPDEDILLHNVDILCDLDFNLLHSFHLENRHLATLCVKQRETSRYLLFDAKDRLCGRENRKTGEKTLIKDCPEPKSYAFSGIHIIRPTLLEKINLKGKFSIIDAYLQVAQCEDIHCFLDKESRWLDVGKPESLLSAASF
ncbi:MAG: nucleotidyltransferase family protein [Bacteroidales bacterium]|nr:nucleotidyltransferase family protein [Bacteroidales bacterium]